MKIQGSFIGTAGVYHVMSELSLLGYHAAATHGNAPDFDILVCNSDGEKSVAIQVKSTRWAARKKGTELDFPLGYKAAKYLNRETLFFAFVDFDVINPDHRKKPDIYLIPSSRVHQFCESWINGYEGKMVRFQVEAERIKEFKNDFRCLKLVGIVPSQIKPEDTEE